MAILEMKPRSRSIDYAQIPTFKTKERAPDTQDPESPFLPSSEQAVGRAKFAFLPLSRTLCIYIILSFFNSLIILLAVFRPDINESAKDVACGKRLSQPSPAWDAVKYEVQQFEGGLHASSPWAGEPSDEVDAAWHSITETGFFGLSEAEWRRLNPHTEEAVKLPGGKYLATLDVFHKLHCVDLLRRAVYFGYYHDKYPAFQNLTDATITEHLGHCIQILRMNIMCEADLTVMTYNWMDGRPTPMPYFRTVHTCKNWDSVIEWMKGVDVSHDIVPVKPDGQKELPALHKHSG